MTILKRAGGQGRGSGRVPARTNGKPLTCLVREHKTYGKGKVGFFVLFFINFFIDFY